MITYAEWRSKYVASDENGLYVSYNAQGLSQPKDAITVSEASGYAESQFTRKPMHYRRVNISVGSADTACLRACWLISKATLISF